MWDEELFLSGASFFASLWENDICLKPYKAKQLFVWESVSGTLASNVIIYPRKLTFPHLTHATLTLLHAQATCNHCHFCPRKASVPFVTNWYTFPLLTFGIIRLIHTVFWFWPNKVKYFGANHTCPYQIKVTFGVSIQISEGTFSNYFALNKANIKCTPLAS